MPRPICFCRENQANMTSKKVTAILTSTTTFSARSSGTGCISEVAPSVKKILKMFDPRTFPTTISALPLRAATIDAISSGNDVPGPTISRTGANNYIVVNSISHSISPWLTAARTVTFRTRRSASGRTPSRRIPNRVWLFRLKGGRAETRPPSYINSLLAVRWPHCPCAAWASWIFFFTASRLKLALSFSGGQRAPIRNL